MDVQPSCPTAAPGRTATALCVAAMLALAVAMGIGRFAFTPLFPLMVRDGLIDGHAGAMLAAANYLGYLVGALAAGRLRVRPLPLLSLGLLGTVFATAAAGWTADALWWGAWRFLAGVMSAWTLVATSAWGLAWLAHIRRPALAGVLFSGVGVGIALAGLYCLLLGNALPAPRLWTGLAVLAALVASLPLALGRRLGEPPAPAAANPVAPAASAPATAAVTPASARRAPGVREGALVACYTLFGFGYILPATYLPLLARRLVEDPGVFGLAWPLFGVAAALSTVAASWRLARLGRLRVWAAAHLLMAAGVLLPALVATLASVSAAAVLVGGTFMVITMTGMQVARQRGAGDATRLMGRMTAGFALGQLAGPLASAGLARWTADEADALRLGLVFSACGLLGSAAYLWRHRD